MRFQSLCQIIRYVIVGAMVGPKEGHLDSYGGLHSRQQLHPLHSLRKLSTEVDEAYFASPM